MYPLQFFISSVPSPKRAVLIGALAGLSWNAFGVVQFVRSLSNTPQSLIAMGMSAEQAAVYSSYPAWMSIAFAVGGFGGLVGCLLLLLGHRYSTPTFAASLTGYLVLYVGDITEGVFAALGMKQVVLLTIVVTIAAALLAWSRHLNSRGLVGRTAPVES